MDLKNINIGTLIEKSLIERGIEMDRICSFLSCTEKEVLQMYKSSHIDTKMLLRWSKLLEYDFFRLYSQHLVFYSPQASMNYNQPIAKSSSLLPQFRKNLYTKEIIEFVLAKVNKKEMTKNQVINEYKIPKTTLYKWLQKYRAVNNNVI
ncbi:transposase [Chryseobacterium soli]|uniref:transposase n=1 Tax=Chryseobacterium soli TaxID=445961 RepID=UPI002954530D|nr:transposase [Chryseobacterium soli]MDV7699277.1 transposase [Chryseobacterium soli]